MSSKDSDAVQKRARFRFKAEIYDTYKDNNNISFYVINVKIYGLNVDEYEIKKRFSQFANFDARLRARFHHKRLPQLPSKTFTNSSKHADEFISKRKISLNRYLRGVGQRLYLQNCEAIWHFFEFINKINPYLHRYRVLHLKSIQCNDYQFIDEKDVPSKEAETKSSSFSFRNLFASASATKSTNKLSFATSKSNKKVLREWKVLYGAFIASNIYLSVSTIHSDNTKNNWWDTFMSTANDLQSQILSNNPITTNDELDNDMDDYDDDQIEQPPQSINPEAKTKDIDDEDEPYNRQDRLESVDFDTQSDLNANANPNPSANTAKKGLSAWEAEKLAFAENEFYLGKIEIYKWEDASNHNDSDEIMYTSYCRFPLVRNRPSCAIFINEDDLLLVGTSHGKVLCFKLNRNTYTISHICYLPRVFGSYVTDMIAVECSLVYYKPTAYEVRAENPLPRGTEKTQEIGNSFLYAVSNDCHLAVFDLRTGDCLGHVQTGITGNLGITYCCEKLFVSNKSNNNIVVFIRSSATGDPVPQTELIGHTTTVYALHADEYNKRLFSGSGDNSVAVWYYDKLQDTMLQIQQLKSVSKSSRFTCITTAKGINCLIAGADNGFITIWHEYDINCDELSDKMYDLRMLLHKRDEQKEQKTQYIASENIDITDNVPPSLTQQYEILKQNERRFDISKNNLKNGSISSKKSKSNMVWKCVYTWKAHKGVVTRVNYYDKYNMLMSTSNSGQIRLVYLCDPGKVPPMQMVDKVETFPDFIKDKLDKIFNEIREIESNNYPSTQYQNLGLFNDYEAGNDESVEESVEDNKVEEEDEEEEEIPMDDDKIVNEELKIDKKVADDIWEDGGGGDNEHKASDDLWIDDDDDKREEEEEEDDNESKINEKEKENANEKDNDNKTESKEKEKEKENENEMDEEALLDEAEQYEHTSLAELL